MSVLVDNIQRFSLHDGEGIRTTVFLKGCPLRCPWCANPENLEPRVMYMLQQKKCIAKDGHCIFTDSCTVLHNQKHQYSERDAVSCPIGAFRKSGVWWEPNDLVNELVKDKHYFSSGGGITFSGGEPLIWTQQLSEVWDLLHDERINLCCESSLFIPSENMKQAVQKLDSFIIDIKVLDPVMCKTVLHGNLDQYMSNLEILFQSNKSVVMRMPLVRNVTATKKNIEKVLALIEKYQPDRLELFSVHNLAESKYSGLGHDFIKHDELTEQELYTIRAEMAARTSVRVKICRL